MIYSTQGRDTDDARNRRRDTSVELRKNKRVEQLMKKRQTDDAEAIDDDAPAETATAGGVSNIQSENHLFT